MKTYYIQDFVCIFVKQMNTSSEQECLWCHNLVPDFKKYFFFEVI